MDELIARLEKHRDMSAKGKSEFSLGVANGINFALDLLRIQLHADYLEKLGWVKK